MKEKLLQAYKNKKMISIYDNSYYPNNFLVAYILCTDDKSYIAYELSPNGEFDCYTYRLFDNIIKIEKNTKYLNCIKRLAQYHKIDVNEDIFSQNKSNIFKFLDYIIKNQRICSVSTTNSDTYDVVGFVEKYNDNTVKILLIDEFGVEDGIVEIKLDAISLLKCCSHDEIKLEILYKINK